MADDQCQCIAPSTGMRCKLRITTARNMDHRYCSRHQMCAQSGSTHTPPPRVPVPPPRVPVPQLVPPAGTGRKECDKLGGFVNINNSCYLDSVLYALFHMDNYVIDSLFIDVNFDKLVLYGPNIPLKEIPELYEIVRDIHQFLVNAKRIIATGQSIKCTPLRQLLVNYTSIAGKGEKLKWMSEQLAPLDVLTYLTEMFNIPDTVTFEQTTYDVISDKEMVQSDSTRLMRPYLIDVHQSDISDFTGDSYKNRDEVIDIMSLINSTTITEDAAGQLTRRSLSLVDANMLLVYLNRIAGNITEQRQLVNATKITTFVIPDELIKTSGGKILSLSSIIVHIGDANHGHYITYIKCGNKWYLYNDVSFKNLRPLGTYDQMMDAYFEQITQNAVGFLYI